MTTLSGQNLTRAVKKYNISPKMPLGQHFIVDDSFLEKMIVRVNKNTTVIEIGPGMGQLTEFLSRKAKKVIAIEIDKQFERPLRKLQKRCKNMELIFGDALSEILNKTASAEKKLKRSVQIVSNLPYHITEPFINKLAHLGNIEAILMVGKKFGFQSRIKDPKDSKFSGLSFVCRSFFKVTKIIDVPKEVFYPIPKTDSVILSLISRNPSTLSLVEFIGQRLILGQEHGILVKNALVKAIQVFEKQHDSNILNKNTSRELIGKLDLPEEILKKPFSQLNNEEIRTIAKSLDTQEPFLITQ